MNADKRGSGRTISPRRQGEDQSRKKLNTDSTDRRKPKTLPRINADRRGSGKQESEQEHGAVEKQGQICRENSLMRCGQTNYSRGPSTPARSPSTSSGSFAVGQDDISRNMARYPMVRKDYDFAAKFVPQASYNEEALVYSELLACGAHSTMGNAALGLKDRTQ
jgi:hypothetical protein